jgi:hypothetical protein
MLFREGLFRALENRSESVSYIYRSGAGTSVIRPQWTLSLSLYIYIEESENKMAEFTSKIYEGRQQFQHYFPS